MWVMGKCYLYYSSGSFFLSLDLVKSIFPKIPPVIPPISPINGTKMNEPKINVAKKVLKNRPPEPKNEEVIVAKMKSRNRKDNIADQAPDLNPPLETKPPTKEPISQITSIKTYTPPLPKVLSRP